MTNYTKKAVFGAGASILMGFLAALVMYFTRIIMARNLGPKDYGLFYSVFTVVIFFLFFRNLGLQISLVKFISEFRAKNEFNNIKTSIVFVFLFQLASSLIMGIILFIMANFLSKNYFKEIEAALILKLLLLYILFSILFIIIKGVFQGFQKFLLFSSVELSKNIIVLIAIFILFKNGFGILSPVIAYVVVGPLLVILYLPFALKLFKFFKYNISNFQEVSYKMIKFGLPAFATSFGGRIIGYIDTLILTLFRPLHDVGVYNAILPSALILLYLGRAAGGVILPISSELWTNNDKTRLSKGLELLHRYVLLISLPMILTVFVFAGKFIEFLFGPEYLTGTWPFRVILLGVIFFTMALINNQFITGIGKPKTVTQIILISAAINLILNIALIPKWGIIGAAFATSSSYLLALVLSMKKITKYIYPKYPYSNLIKLFLCGSIFVIVLSLAYEYMGINGRFSIIIYTILVTIVYLCATYWTGIISAAEIKQQLKLLK